MKTMTLDEAAEQLREAEARYRAVEEKHNEELVGVQTAERVLNQIEVRAALEDAARELLEARELYIQIKETTTKQRQERARAELEAVEADLVVAVEDAEKAMSEVEAQLKRVVDLSRRRYAHRQEATGKASRSLLARNALAGWLVHRLSGLELPDLDRAPHHYRAPLAELLGLDRTTTGFDTTDGGDQ